MAFSSLTGLNLDSNVQHQKIIHLPYPNNEPEGLVVLNYTNYSSPVKFDINLTLQYEGTLAEGTPVNVSASGALYDLSFPIKILAVGFENANSNVGEQGEIIITNPLTSPTIYYPSQIDFNLEANGFGVIPNRAIKEFETISWDAPGDYVPFITIWYLNDTQTTYLYQTRKIHVSASDVIVQEKFSTVNLWLAIAVLFATSVMLVLAIIPKKYSDMLLSDDKKK